MIKDEEHSKTVSLEESNLQQKIFVEKVKILYKNLVLNITANFVCVAIVFLALVQNHQNNSLLFWLIAMFILSLFRYSLYLFNKYKPGKHTLYFELYITGLLVSGTLWGVCAFYLMPIDNPYDQMVIIVIIAGVTAGSIQSLQVSFISSVLYILVSIFPLCVWLFLHGGTHHLSLSLAMTVYVLFTIISAFRGSKLLEKALRLSFENEQLIERLSLANTELISLNKQSNLMISDLQQQEVNSKIINRMNEALQTCKLSNEAYLIIGHSAKELFQHLSGGLVIFNKSTKQLKTRFQWGSEQILKENFSIDDCWALRQGHLYLADPGESLICYHFETPPAGGYLCIPQMSTEGVMGMFFLSAPQKMAITPIQQQLATTLNEIIKLSLSNISLHEILNEQSVHDALTWLYNRRFLDEVLPRELLRNQREKQSLCVCMIDIDFFKRFNDANGHEAGDAVLKYMGEVLEEHFRGSDIAARFGGEEFVLIAVNSDINTILPRLESLREVIKTHHLKFRGKQLPQITISVGVAEAPRQGATMADILQAADEAMYLAKQNGRDRVVVFGY